MKLLKDLFLDELADIYDAERQTVKAMPKIAKAATCDKLKKALLAHLKETEGHMRKLEKVFQSFNAKVKAAKCKATMGLIEEGDELAADFKGSPAINAALISAAQRVEHHEMASYGCLHEWAGLLGNQKAAILLQEILDEERAANETLIELARITSNPEALGECEEKVVKASPIQRRGIMRPVKLSRSRVNLLPR